MRTPITFLLFCTIAVIAMIVGITRSADSKQGDTGLFAAIPTMGRIEILNGCGVPGAGKKVEEFLRRKGFDVKKTEDAPSWNYPYTMVVSRTDDMRMAQRLCTVLRTDRSILMRTNDDLFDVSIFVGFDYEEKIR